MKKIIIVTSITLLLAAAAAGYVGYTIHKSNMAKDNCLQRLGANNTLGVDANGYCGCVSDYFKLHPFYSAASTERTSYADHIKSCMGQYYKPPVMVKCESMNKKIMSLSVDCTCMYDKLTSSFIDGWVSGGESLKISKDDLMKSTEDALKSCTVTKIKNNPDETTGQ